MDSRQERDAETKCLEPDFVRSNSSSRAFPTRFPETRRLGMVDRQRTDALVSEYLESGGRIRRLPEAVPATPAEVLEYLLTRDVKVEAVPANNASDTAKFRHEGRLLTWSEILQLANERRREQQLPPFASAAPKL
jgi:hypothetical protein